MSVWFCFFFTLQGYTASNLPILWHVNVIYLFVQVLLNFHVFASPLA